MRKKGLVLLLVLFLTITLSFAVTKTTSVGLLQNTARIFDFDNDGYNDALAFSDRIDSTLSKIILHKQNNSNFYKYQTITEKELKHCALSYQDYNLDGKIDIFFSCLNSSNQVVSELHELNNGKYEQTFTFTSEKTFTQNYYGDVLFFDFNNNGYSEILSCFLVDDNNLSIYYYNGVSFTKKTTNIPSTENNCNLVPLDINGNGYFDIIQYTYDANNFSLYLNNQNSEIPFIKEDPSEYFNMTFFSNVKIKTLKAYDSNNSGYSDLYYVVDLNNTGSTRDIEFGYFINNVTKEEITLNPPILNLTYLGGHRGITYSWDNDANEESIFNINITKTNNKTVTYNILINSSSYIYGDFFDNSYDYNSGFGNMLYRVNSNFSFPNIGFNASVQAILPSGMKSEKSNIEEYRPFYTYNESFQASGQTFYPEFCDGFDTNLDGIVDGGFEIIWPDGKTENLTFQRGSNDCLKETYSFSHNDWRITLTCIGNVDNICVPENKETTSNVDRGGVSLTSPQQETGTETNTNPKTDDPKQESPKIEEPKQQEEERIILDKESSAASAERIISAISENKIRHTREYSHITTSTKVTEKIRNLNLYSAENISLILEIPKSIIPNVSYIQKLDDFVVIRNNPIIAFQKEKLDSYQEYTFSYILPGRITESQLDTIITNITLNQELREEQRREVELQLEATEKVVQIETKTEIIGNKTIITLDIDVDKFASLTNVSIYQEIPKCLVEEINHLIATSDVPFEIIDADPLIVWHFDKLIDMQKIQLQINKLADDDCIDEVITMALAKQIIFSTSEIDYKKVILSALLIPAFALILIILSSFTHHKTHHDKKVNKLIKYIKTCHQKSIKNETIITKLKQKGWDEEIIKEAFKLNAKNKTHYYFQKLNIGVHEIVLLFLIFLNILEFLHMLSGDVDYFKKIISWIILGYLLYRVSISSIITGRANKILDIALIFSFFLLTMKNLVSFAKVAIMNVDLVQDLYAFIWRYNHIFETYLFLAGLIGIIIISILLSLNPARNPSITASLIKKQNFVKRLVVVHLSLVGFFVIVFNLMFEWLAIAVDSFVLITTIFVILFLAIKHHKKILDIGIIEEIAEDAEHVYEKIVSLFHYKKFLLLGISGMLILFILTEVANFIVPYITGIYNIIYFGNFDSMHTPLFYLKDFLNPHMSLFAQQIQGLDIAHIIFLALIYLFNIFAILYLLILPGRVWYNYFKQKDKPLFEVKHFRLKPFEIAIFISSLIIFITKPIFRITTLRTYDIVAKEKTLVGVDILTQAVNLEFMPILILISLLAGVLLGVLSLKAKKLISDHILLISFAFFTYYLYLFAITQYQYYIETIKSTLNIQPMIAVYLMLFMLITFIFLYGLGYITILYLYLPRWYQKTLKNMPIIGKILIHQHHHHIKHRDAYEDDHILQARKYIKKSLESGHELFITIEHLEEKGFEIEEIRQAIQLAVPDEAIWKGLDHYHHYHHNKEIIHALHKYIKKEYKKKDLKTIINETLNVKFTEQEIVQALKKTAKKTKNKHSKKIGQDLDSHWKKLDDLIIKAENNGVEFNKIHECLYFVKNKEGAILAEHVANTLVKRNIKFSDFVKSLRNFRFTEEDIRLALRFIKPKNAYDDEIIRWV